MKTNLQWQKWLNDCMKKTSRGDEYVHYLDCGYDFRVYICQNSLSPMLKTCSLVYININAVELSKTTKKEHYSKQSLSKKNVSPVNARYSYNTYYPYQFSQRSCGISLPSSY